MGVNFQMDVDMQENGNKNFRNFMDLYMVTPVPVSENPRRTGKHAYLDESQMENLEPR